MIFLLIKRSCQFECFATRDVSSSVPQECIENSSSVPHNALSVRVFRRNVSRTIGVFRNAMSVRVFRRNVSRTVGVFLATLCQFECSAGMYREQLERKRLLDTLLSVALEVTLEWCSFQSHSIDN